MNKICSIILAIIMVLCFTSCEQKGSKNSCQGLWVENLSEEGAGCAWNFSSTNAEWWVIWSREYKSYYSDYYRDYNVRSYPHLSGYDYAITSRHTYVETDGRIVLDDGAIMDYNGDVLHYGIRVFYRQK